LLRSSPDTWVTERTGYIGNTFGPNGFCKEHPRLQIEVSSQIIIHKADEPDAVVNFFDADGAAPGSCLNHRGASTIFEPIELVRADELLTGLSVATIW